MCVGTPTYKLTHILTNIRVAVAREGSLKCLNIITSATLLGSCINVVCDARHLCVKNTKAGYSYACTCGLRSTSKQKSQQNLETV